MAGTQAEQSAQQWHDQQVAEDADHEQFSSCWCCCWSCDPDATEGRGNPYFAEAQAGIRGDA